MQKKYYPDSLSLISFDRRTSLRSLMFPISLLKSICDHINNEKVFKEKYGHFSWRQKIENYFPYNSFAPYIC